MNGLIEYRVSWGLVMACRWAPCPTSRSPVLVKPTTEGVVRPPSSLAMTFGSPPSITATQELVVPKSIPIILPIKRILLNLISPLSATNYCREVLLYQPHDRT